MAYGDGDASFQAAGLHEGIANLVEAFYRHMDTLPEAVTIRNMHDHDLDESADKLRVFLAGWLGGPKEYTAKFGKMRIPHAHQHLSIDHAERDAWMLCMRHAVAERDEWANDFKEYFLREIFRPAEKVRVFSVRRRETQANSQ
ncbi:MAG: group II truncated hemoglobin [Myxococcales bacterium]|nr:group II truncated hemoglobin [Myxococcales bacterium]